MLNIVCVKWGDKYSADYVNRLFKMVSNNISIPFNFYCYTDDSKNIVDNIRIIDIEDDYLEVWWNKLALFQKDFIKGEATNLYFDLDVVIQNKIDSLMNYVKDELTLVRCYWKGNLVTYDNEIKIRNRWDMYANSSVMIWRNNSLSHIWDYFNSNPEYFMMKYLGIDRFLFHEKIKLNFFPKKIIYSRMKGEEEEDYTYGKLYDVKLFKNKKTRIRLKQFKEIYMYHIPERMICIFNGPTEDWTYKEFEHYWS